MDHDAEQNDCDADAYLMAAEEGEDVRTNWSECSAIYLQNLEWATCLFEHIIS